MQFFRASRVAAVLIFLVVAQVLITPVWADPPTDTGTVTVTGSVAPKGASITTSLAVSPAGTTFAQDATAEYILTYSSSAPGSFPLTLQAEWGKGQIAGATEPTVEVVTYVVGSATTGYADTVPVIDTTLRTITWTIPSLPGGSGTHEVRFKLKTTDSYTGSLLVEFPVSLKVLSPTGATDRLIEVPYQYVAPKAVAVDPTATPTSLPNSTPTPVPNTFESIAIRSTGKTSARIAVTTAQPSQLVLNVGTAPTSLGVSVSSLKTSTEHLLYLENLAAGTQYYFQVSLLTATGSTASDIFTFTTAQQTAADATRKPTSVTFMQQRSVLYSGPTTAENQDAIKPIPVAHNSVVDLSLVIPNATELKTVEILVRPATVLGSATEVVELDALQSTTTVMTRIADNVFVGKLRMPVLPGAYVVVSRIEDWYGSLSEEIVGTVQITKPFTVAESGTGKPLFGAAVQLSIYNQQTKLYETVSNVSTSIPNPAVTNELGEIVYALPPARYRASITLPGFQSQTVDFELGNDVETQYPQIQLVPIGNLITRYTDFSTRQFQYEWQRLVRQLIEVGRSPQLFSVLLMLQLCVTAILGAVLYFRPAVVFASQRNFKKLGVSFVVLQFVLRNGVRYSFESLLVMQLVFGIVFYQLVSFVAATGFLAIAGLNLALWLRCLWLLQPTKK